MSPSENTITFALSGDELTAGYNGIDQPGLVDDTAPSGMPLELYIIATSALAKNTYPILAKIVADFEQRFRFLQGLTTNQLRTVFLLRQDATDLLSKKARILGLVAIGMYPDKQPSNKHNSLAFAEGSVVGNVAYPFLQAGTRLVTEGTVLHPGLAIDNRHITPEAVRNTRLDFLNVLYHCAGYLWLKVALEKVIKNGYLDRPLPPNQLVYDSPLPPMKYGKGQTTTTTAQDKFPATVVMDRSELRTKYEALVHHNIAPCVEKWFQAD